MIDFKDFNENISDELLAAYIDGNATSEENSIVAKAIENPNGILRDSFELIQDSMSLIDNDTFFSMDDDRFSDEDVSVLKNSFDFINEETLKIMTSSRNYHTTGEPGENISDPVYIQQPDDHSCALRSQQIVLRDFGIDIPFDQLEELAKHYGVYTDDGTYTYDIGKVLQIAGVGMHQVEGTSLMDLTNELAQGHRVIVSVDANELWYNDSFTGKLKNWFDDTFGAQGGNHALIVAGVEVNTQNPEDIKVVLTDPGAGHLRIEYPLEQFMDAWKDSNCFMAATNDPAPYQYDAETGMEVPSNFAVQQYVNEFVATHGYQLSPDMINIPQDYQPAFTGHLSMVGNMDYSEFEDNYQDYLENHTPSALSIQEQIEEMAKSHMEELNNSVVDDVKEDGEDGTDYAEQGENEEKEVDDADGADDADDNDDLENYDNDDENSQEEISDEESEDDEDEND